MIPRNLHEKLLEALSETPSVALLGPRQAGKTTLALEFKAKFGGIYLDLESEQDRAKLSEPELFLSSNLDRLVILDEVQRMPGIFPLLRGLIDRARREGKGPGRYLLLGSASPELLRQSGESLAGRIRYLELPPFSLAEPTGKTMNELWLRGGFPGSLLAGNDQSSLRWRRDFIRTYLERDIPFFAPRITGETLRRLWVMLAHRQGALLNAAELAKNLGVDAKTVARYTDILVDLFLIRRLTPWHSNTGKRLVKSPKLFIRDSGLVHALLDIKSLNDLSGHPVVGGSWEGFVIEQVLSNLPEATTPYFYRSSAGAEIDLVLDFGGTTRWAIEIKRSLNPAPRKGFYFACSDLSPHRKFVVYPGSEQFPVGADIEAVPLSGMVGLVRNDL